MANDCIDPKYVPCEKARAYLKKHGRLCEVTLKGGKSKPKKPKEKGFFDQLFDILDNWFG